MGKGRPEEARVGALFEAVEHYLTGPARFDPAVVAPAAAGDLAAGPLRADVCALLLAGMPGRRMACLRYRSLGGDGQALVPLFLSAPWYVESGGARLRELAGDDCDYTHLMRYSCNSGSAAGVTEAEALLHALNEAIERDALSLLLVRAFLSGDGLRLRLIDPETLPYGLARAYATAREVTGSPVHLLDITSDAGVPTMLAYTAPTSRHPHRRGAGTSLSPAYAAWRALTELVQTTLGECLSSSGASAHGDLSRLAAHPALHACGRFDLTGLLAEARVVPFPRDAPAVGPPAGQLRKVVAMLAARGHTAYHRTVWALPGEVTAVHVYVPGFERFMLVTDGNLVVPGRRGRAAAAGKVFPK
jgi:ribosomal protein S12 methylthiotransferase accessory factor